MQLCAPNKTRRCRLPTAKTFQDSQLITALLMGLAGSGKSSLAMCAPGPIAALLVDKPICASLPPGTPGYDPNNVFWKSYPPPDTDLKDEKAKRPRNVADAIYNDIQVVKNALIKGQPEFKMNDETWPAPRTLLIEGGDFIAKHVENWVCAVNQKGDPSEWEDKFEPWRRRFDKLNQIYDLLTYLPSARLCNVVVTTGLDEESKMIKNERGKSELVKTGVIDPDLGGKMNIEGPRKFANAFLCLAEAGKWWVVTKPQDKFKGYRGVRSGSFGLPPVIDVTVDPNKPHNIWSQLFTQGGKR